MYSGTVYQLYKNTTKVDIYTEDGAPLANRWSCVNFLRASTTITTSQGKASFLTVFWCGYRCVFITLELIPHSHNNEESNIYILPAPSSAQLNGEVKHHLIIIHLQNKLSARCVYYLSYLFIVLCLALVGFASQKRRCSTNDLNLHAPLARVEQRQKRLIIIISSYVTYSKPNESDKIRPTHPYWT